MFVEFFWTGWQTLLIIDKPGMIQFSAARCVNWQIPTWDELREGFSVYCEFPICNGRRWITLNYEGGNVWEVEVCMNQDAGFQRLATVRVPTESLAMLVNKVEKNRYAHITLSSIIEEQVTGAVNV